MVYLDTSILVPLFVPEDASQTIRNWFAKQSQAELTISEWACTEFVSAIGIKVLIVSVRQLKLMSEDLVTIEVDSRPLKAR
jgi:predicted nucleic acid-binding protein